MTVDENFASLLALLSTYDRVIAEREAELEASAAEILRLETDANAAFGVATSDPQ